MNDATPPSIFDRVAGIVAEHQGADRLNLTAETDLFDDLGADSLDRVELALALEEEFDVEISDELVETSRTVGALAQAVERSIQRRAVAR